tara:strand:+ start:466 stop:723 length:258 start_codon:yes stop_codon:yes gene_type:complete
MSKLIKNKKDKDMLQVIEEYLDGGYVYTVKDTNKFDEEQSKQLFEEEGFQYKPGTGPSDDEWCHYSGMPNPAAYEKSREDNKDAK